MKLKKWALVAEIAGAAAIVVSLVFVGLEIRRNTEASQAATFQASVAYDLELLGNQGRDPDTARVFLSFINDPDSLSDGEYSQGLMMAIANVRHMENLYLQHQAGMLSDEAWTARESYVRGVINNPGYLQVIQTRLLSGQFVDYVNELQSDSLSDP